MTSIELEHVNITVKDPEATAQRLCNWFGWKVRWHGPSMSGGVTYHVGTDRSYVALYSGSRPELGQKEDNYATLGGLNHIAVVVDDLDAIEGRLRASGLTPHSHADYEPGRRFYFDDPDGIEYEVVSYQS